MTETAGTNGRGPADEDPEYERDLVAELDVEPEPEPEDDTKIGEDQGDPGQADVPEGDD